MIPIGSVVGIALITFVVGVLIGRSSKAMTRAAAMHAAVHSDPSAKANAHADQRVQVVTLLDPMGVPKVDGRYVLDEEIWHGDAHVVAEAVSPPAPRELNVGVSADGSVRTTDLERIIRDARSTTGSGVRDAPPRAR